MHVCARGIPGDIPGYWEDKTLSFILEDYWGKSFSEDTLEYTQDLHNVVFWGRVFGGGVGVAGGECLAKTGYSFKSKAWLAAKQFVGHALPIFAQYD